MQKHLNATSPDARVIVVGAGILGLSVAIELAQAGVPVLVLEKGDAGGEQSNFALGWVRTTGRPLAEIPLSLLNRNRFNAWIPDARPLSQGVLFCAKDDAQRAQLAQWAAGAAAFGVKTRLLNAADVTARLPGCTANTAGGLLTDVDTSIDPRHLVQALVAQAVRLGIEIRTHCAVHALDIAAGNARGVITETGIERGTAVVLATGAWTRLMLRNAGITLPCVKVRSALVRLRTKARAPDGLMTCAGVAGIGWRAEPDGSFVVGLENDHRLEVTPDVFRFALRYLPMWWAHRREIKPSFGRLFFDELRLECPRHAVPSPVDAHGHTLRPEPAQRSTALTLRQFSALFPQLGEVQLCARWAGWLDMTPDGLPVISAVDPIPGLFVTAGLCGSGLGTALGAGKLAASLVTGQMPDIDASPFRFNRWSQKAHPLTGRSDHPVGAQ